MTAQARRLPNGLIRPWVVDWWAGVQEQAHLREQGLDLDLNGHELHALGVAISEQRGDGHEPVQDLTLTEEQKAAIRRVARARVLVPAQTQTQDQAQDRDQDQRPSPANRQARADRDGNPIGIDHGRAEHAGGAVQQDRVRNGKNDRDEE
jgi:hypothetical protein